MFPFIAGISSIGPKIPSDLMVDFINNGTVAVVVGRDGRKRSNIKWWRKFKKIKMDMVCDNERSID